VTVNAPTRRGFVRFLNIIVVCALTFGTPAAFAAFTMTEIITPGFGIFFGGNSGRQFILNTDGTITGANANDYMMGALAGELELKKTGGKLFPVNIVADNISTLGGLSVASVLCKFQNDPQTTCGGSGISVSLQGKRKLLLGLDISTTQFHNAGDTASITFDITVTFL
jgi:hypothetical protein